VSAGSAEQLGLRPLQDFDQSAAAWPRGHRLPALREVARDVRARFKEQGRVTGLRTIDLESVAYPTRCALAGTARGVSPYVSLTTRVLVVRFDDFEGAERTLVWNPGTAEGRRQSPYYSRLADGDDFLASRVFTSQYCTVPEALAQCGLRPDQVDFVAFGNLQLQDMRRVMGTTRPVGDEATSRDPLFPRAKFLCQRREADTFGAIHPLQWPWYVPGGMDDVAEEHLVLLDGDVEVGLGVALLATPGHTAGNQSLCVHTEDGVWVCSQNGVAADNWHPHLSKIPGVRQHAEDWHREVIMGSSTVEDSIDGYDSMVKEKEMADANRSDPRWRCVLPASELASRRRQWPVLPTFVYGGLEHGRVEPPR